jgi:hypothetical protein
MEEGKKGGRLYSSIALDKLRRMTRLLDQGILSLERDPKPGLPVQTKSATYFMAKLCAVKEKLITIFTRIK